LFIPGVNKKCVIPQFDNLTQGNSFDIAKIHHHAVSRIPVALNHLTRQRNFQGIAVSVQMTALTTVIRNTVAGVKLQPTGDTHDGAISGLKQVADCIIAA
jgi:hypothetical protein